jgi:hypothetical protein
MDIDKHSNLSKNSKGGARPGAGRKKGAANRKTVETQALVAASGLTPLEFMLDVMRNSEDGRMRFAAAQAAAPYVHAKLSSIDLKADVTTRSLAEELNELNEAVKPDSEGH